VVRVTEGADRRLVARANLDVEREKHASARLSPKAIGNYAISLLE
jgi:hypothetical protein